MPAESSTLYLITRDVGDPLPFVYFVYLHVGGLAGELESSDLECPEGFPH